MRRSSPGWRRHVARGPGPRATACLQLGAHARIRTLDRRLGSRETLQDEEYPDLGTKGGLCCRCAGQCGTAGRIARHHVISVLVYSSLYREKNLSQTYWWSPPWRGPRPARRNGTMCLRQVLPSLWQARDAMPQPGGSPGVIQSVRCARFSVPSAGTPGFPVQLKSQHGYCEA